MKASEGLKKVDAGVTNASPIDASDSLIDASLLEWVGENPPVQYGLNDVNLDTIYLGSDPSVYGGNL